jgi:hypothetical protein
MGRRDGFIKSTKKRDDIINTRFVKTKINQCSIKISPANAPISYHQIRLGTHWTQSLAYTNLSSTPSHPHPHLHISFNYI